ncbi:hypothetical protein OF83DRAFT_1178704 [Amylostereum chailletii]|nr:hypothetical protein OF83DRAFT_1178704 [Amylostereum chailletii]
MSSLSARTTCRAGLLEGNEFVDDHFGAAAFVLSWATNMWSTTLISYKAWRHRRLITGNLRSRSIRSQAEKVMMLFVESGVLYCALWSVLVAYILIREFGFGREFSIDTPKWRFTDRIDELEENGLIHLIGMYPTILVALVSLQKLRGTHNFTLESTLNRPPAPLHEPPSRRVAVRVNTHVETLDIETEAHSQTSAVDIHPERDSAGDSDTISTVDGDGGGEKADRGYVWAVAV